ncbi:hypothetical protein ACOSP7_024313 [Xanthoceras sorbifolium]
MKELLQQNSYEKLSHSFSSHVCLYSRSLSVSTHETAHLSSSSGSHPENSRIAHLDSSSGLSHQISRNRTLGLLVGISAPNLPKPHTWVPHRGHLPAYRLGHLPGYRLGLLPRYQAAQLELSLSKLTLLDMSYLMITNEGLFIGDVWFLFIVSIHAYIVLFIGTIYTYTCRAHHSTHSHTMWAQQLMHSQTMWAQQSMHSQTV